MENRYLSSKRNKLIILSLNMTVKSIISAHESQVINKFYNDFTG